MPKKRTETPSFMVDAHGAHDPVDGAEIAKHLEAGEFFWLDLHKPTADDLALLSDVFKFHPLAVEDADPLRPASQVSTPSTSSRYLVVYGANEDKDGLVEVHCFFSGTYLVTVHRDSCPPFDELRRRATAETQPPAQGVKLLYMVVDSLADSFFPESQPSSTTASTSSRTACCRSPTTHSCRSCSASSGGWSRGAR